MDELRIDRSGSVRPLMVDEVPTTVVDIPVACSGTIESMQRCKDAVPATPGHQWCDAHALGSLVAVS